MKPTLILGIAGGSGSGKSTVVERLLQGPYGEQISLLRHDEYYHDAQRMSASSDGSKNWDHPDSLDNTLYLQHVRELRAGQTVLRPIYDFVNHRRSSHTAAVAPRPVLLLEGILLFAIPPIREQIDLCVYIDTPADLRLVRRLIRDIHERGRSPQSVVDQYLTTVRPMHEQFVEPSRNGAHSIIPWTDDNPPGIDLLTARIARAVQEAANAC